ncbi:LysM peptidoglycan-binding domain-containing protein [Sporolactobacillus shoreicorticis]|uniref:LysM peptidoglycan-binding domain-containing protein n=1 Tax=Sporolactobacillus shoreicorticis TaxID=1923877 RepID=A0ABW5S6X9_9BACL|nr:LysM peptidoglycan-binding domain-containing protein [Sporolactobacillus shoreicorticis]MCO7125670.1 LysM peptidoglycan-binding domain-containing protein [Sporolactobacillus shoreicorticis]
MNTHANNKTKGISFIVLFCIMTVILFFTLTNTVAADQNNYVKITVKSGDSLWSIATTYHADNSRLSKHAFVAWVKDNNGLVRDRIVPNQKLIIPVTAHQLTKR